MPKLKKRKSSCGRCAAYYSGVFCLLGFSQYRKDGSFSLLWPREACPKPISIKKLRYYQFELGLISWSEETIWADVYITDSSGTWKLR